MARIKTGVGVVGIAVAAAWGAGAAEAPPITRVVLSSAGLIDIERAIRVDGAAVLTLPVSLDKVDDLLKTLVVRDPAGPVEAVRLPGKEPLAQEFRSLPFEPADLDEPARLLRALRGAEVSVSGARTITGRIVSVVEESDVRDGQTLRVRHRLSILTASGLESVIVEEAGALTFTDPAVRAQVDRALGASLRNRAKDERQVEVVLAARGPREVRLSYVVEAPLWKTAYRLLLPERGPTAALQGWAVLENMTGADWNNVELALISGNPVTFRQALYESYYNARPEMPVQVFGRVIPRADTGAIRERAETMARMAPPPPPPAPAPMVAMAAPSRSAAGESAMAQVADAPAPEPRRQAAQSEDTGAQVAFQFPGRFTVAAGQSLMVPLVMRDVPVERIALYQPDVNPQNPLAALQVTNDSGASLPAGILTLFEGNRALFAGDARFPNLPQGDRRLISYAVDQKTQIQRTATSARPLVKVAAAGGVFRATRQVTLETTYRIQAPVDDGRTVIIEHQRSPGYTLEAPASVETTATHHRIRQVVEAGKQAEVVVRQTQTTDEQIRVGDIDPNQIVAWVRAAGDLGNTQAVAQLNQIAELRRAQAEVDRKGADIEARVTRIRADQERVRANLASVPKESDLAKRYLASLTTQENDLAKLEQDRQQTETARAAARSKLDAAIAQMAF